jgi:hypothetical protein
MAGSPKRLNWSLLPRDSIGGGYEAMVLAFATVAVSVALIASSTRKEAENFCAKPSAEAGRELSPGARSDAANLCPKHKSLIPGMN